MLIWKQGQFYPELGKKIVELPNEVYPGPSDPMIKIDGFNVLPDEHGDFIHGVNGVAYTEDELDAINTYAVIRMVINMYEVLLDRPIHWSWWKDGKGEPLIVKIRNNDINARFIKEYRCIELDYYGPYKNWTYNCRSIDLIAHETGHVILDSILPHLNDGSIESRGIGEAFCDLTAMFWILSQKDLCEYVIRETKGDLLKNSILTLFGVGYGYQENTFKELRSAINKFTYKKNHFSAYLYSQILVAWLYKILVGLMNEGKYLHNHTSERLYKLGKNWSKPILRAYKKKLNEDIQLQEFVTLTIMEFKLAGYDIKKITSE